MQEIELPFGSSFQNLKCQREFRKIKNRQIAHEGTFVYCVILSKE